MKILHSLSEYTRGRKPTTIAIGNFDGVHLGHKAILKELNSLANETQGQSVILTFKDPSDVLKPEQHICTLMHKLKLLEEEGVNLVILTKEPTEQTPEQFLSHLYKVVSFENMVFGIANGKDSQITSQKIQEYANQNHINTKCLSPLKVQGEIVSGTLIREAIIKGDFERVEQLLGRKYSIYSIVKTGKQLGRRIGAPTANIALTGLCLPPLGVYAVKVNHQGAEISGIANLGINPTVHSDNIPILEVHLFDYNGNLYEQNVEVVFYDYVRPEKVFPSIDELKEQIQRDCAYVKNLLQKKGS